MYRSSLLHKDWKDEFSGLLAGSETDLLLSSPFVSREGTDFVLRRLTSVMRSEVRLHLLTNLSPQSICQGATDPEAIRFLAENVMMTTVTHLPRLHAKVYVADTRCAIITSGNLTAGGLMRNQEYGILTTDPVAVRQVRQHIEEFGHLGARVGLKQLTAYCEVAGRIQKAYRKQPSSAQREARQEFARSFRVAEEELVRLRLLGSSPTKIFEDTILYLLRTGGPLSTRQLHPRIQALHPDLCDDTVDRVIDGQHYGKRWKHMVRASQSHLKEHGLVEILGGRWTLTQQP